MDHLTLQDAFNVAVGIGAAFGGWLIRTMYDAIREMRDALQKTAKDLHMANADLAERVQKIEVLVAGEYVRRDELTRVTEALFTKLDKIEAKLEAHMYRSREVGQ